MTITIDGNDLGDVQSIAVTKDANIIQISLPAGDSDEAETFDLLGTTKIITVGGTFSGSTVADIKTSLDTILALVDGDQENSVDFVSEITGTISVKIGSMDFVQDVTSSNFLVRYTLKLLEGQ